jgi:chromosome segregation ATPase
MRTLEQLNTERSQHNAEIEEIQTEIAQWEQQLTHPAIDAQTAKQLRTDANNARSRITSVEHRIFLVDRDIAWIDRKQNSAELMTGYRETMQNWSLDKQDLIGKREALSTRLEETKTQVEKMLAEARQAEEKAATAYAQAVAWGDTQAEHAASTEAQKAAKTLLAAQEHQRRQELIITALKNELKTVDAHIEEADREFANAERSAVWLATERLQEEWDAAALRLVEVGAKLYAGKSYMGWEGMAFFNLKIDGEVNRHDSWGQSDLIRLSRQFTPSEIMEVQPNSPVEVDKAA